MDHAEQTLSHLRQSDASTATFDINLSVHLERMLSKTHIPLTYMLTSAGEGKEYQTAQTNLKYLYWTPAQQMAHHGSAHCGLGTGDLLGTGTISGEVSRVTISRNNLQSNQMCRVSVKQVVSCN